MFFEPPDIDEFLIELILLSQWSLVFDAYGLLLIVLLSFLLTVFSLNVFNIATFFSLKVSLMNVV